ncbi:MAG: MerR family transcriptional regulator [Steroidobacteraceae bacterium]|nr:MerR family transcriptional regulator [Steroidobacteraceae bacterium]
MNMVSDNREHTSYFSIKAVSQATGVSVETLRAWERRYEVVSPSRDPAGRRSYSAADVSRLRLLRAATEVGHTISKVAPLSDSELGELVQQSAGLGRPQSRSAPFVERALAAAEKSDPSGVEDILISAIALLPPGEVAHHVIAPLVREIGERWHQGEISIAQEHMVTDIVRRLVISVSRGYLQRASAPRLVLATMSDERHELGILMCGWLAAARRIHTHYLGIDCPPAEIARYAKEMDASAVCLSIVLPEPGGGTVVQLRELGGSLSEQCEIWLGGSGASELPTEQLPPRTLVLPTAFDFEQRLDLMPLTN